LRRYTKKERRMHVPSPAAVFKTFMKNAVADLKKEFPAMV